MNDNIFHLTETAEKRIFSEMFRHQGDTKYWQDYFNLAGEDEDSLHENLCENAEYLFGQVYDTEGEAAFGDYSHEIRLSFNDFELTDHAQDDFSDYYAHALPDWYDKSGDLETSYPYCCPWYFESMEEIFHDKEGNPLSVGEAAAHKASEDFADLMEYSAQGALEKDDGTPYALIYKEYFDSIMSDFLGKKRCELVEKLDKIFAREIAETRKEMKYVSTYFIDGSVCLFTENDCHAFAENAENFQPVFLVNLRNFEITETTKGEAKKILGLDHWTEWGEIESITAEERAEMIDFETREEAEDYIKDRKAA